MVAVVVILGGGDDGGGADCGGDGGDGDGGVLLFDLLGGHESLALEVVGFPIDQAGAVLGIERVDLCGVLGGAAGEGADEEGGEAGSTEGCEKWFHDGIVPNSEK